MDNIAPPVVVAVDHSPQAVPASRAAAREAARLGRGLRMVHVEHPVRPGWFTSSRAAHDVHELHRRAAEDLLQRATRAVGDLLPASSVQTAVRSGHVAEVLVEESVGASSLVLGGRSGDRIAGPGATAARVVAHAACPVLVLPDEDTAVLVEGRSVVVGVAGRPGEAAVLRAAFEQADARGGDLVVVHSWVEPALEPTYRAIGPLIDWASVRDEEQRLLSEALAGQAGTWPDVTVRPALVRARQVPALRSMASTAELLVVGHRHRGPVTGLGSTTRGLLHHAPCPVLVVPLPAVGRGDGPRAPEDHPGASVTMHTAGR
ncbi:universal stress protein [Klenkia terrae]|uniref:Universal stress protein n=1 Tax=Klenkia terrae TaxID=1052259 RepID=A0ABU8EDB4_9ACTN|nr:universal stress protein [Klenkia terrae]SSC25738.1 Universal stress protein A [Klenkia terrae]